MVGTVVYTIFASGDVQSWAIIEEEEDIHKEIRVEIGEEQNEETTKFDTNSVKYRSRCFYIVQKVIHPCYLGIPVIFLSHILKLLHSAAGPCCGSRSRVL